MAYDAATTYATDTEIQKRTGVNGWLTLIDTSGNGAIDGNELTDAQNEIEAANNIIDAALQTHMDPDSARGSGNDWLRDRCVDISMYRIATMAGRDTTNTIEAVYNEALDMLALVRDGELKVPRLEYPSTANDTGHVRGTPRALNVGGTRVRSKSRKRWRKSRWS